MLYRIESYYFVAGLETDSRGVVQRAAPIIKYMIGWDIVTVIIYCEKKGFKASVVEMADTMDLKSIEL